MSQTELPPLPSLSKLARWESGPVTVWQPLPWRVGPVRLVVGFLRILLVVENWPHRGWHVLDYFPLVSRDDGDLLLIVRQMKFVDHGEAYRIQGELSPSVFSPLGAKDPEARAAMARLGRRGFAVSNDITTIADAEFVWWADGPRPRRSRR